MAGDIDQLPDPARPTSGQPPRVLAVWIRDQIDEVHREILPRLAELNATLEAEAFAWDGARLALCVDSMLTAARALNPGSLRRQGLWQQLTQSTGTAGTRFLENYETLIAATGKSRKALDELSQTFRPHTVLTRKSVVELELEHRTLVNEIKQAVDWLAELVAALAKAPDHDPATTKWAEAARHAAADLKALHHLNDVIGEVNLAGSNVLERRADLLERIRKTLEAFDKRWVHRMSVIALDCVNPKQMPRGLPAAEEVHALLVGALEATNEAGTALQLEEQGFERLLAQMRSALVRN